ncbi:hypothetical protein [Jiangella sp. DSM 45060]|uniref:hypothetical protein n=1 Tax=Jiangella sp. DSM 45060 TaxID=1798224 RepID=UPI00087D646F|nr:hypothetical protein [Jiangella sp. DSM 45060]SDT09016.1 hypothetical protein SAMN04515669_2748 [Jiangella sp. DSM 45060]
MTDVRLSVSEEIGVARSGEVVVCGVPVSSDGPLAVLVDGAVVPHQSLWRRGGWVGLAFPVSVGARASAEVVVRPAGEAGPPPAVTSAAGVSGLSLTTGVVTAELGLSPFTVAVPALGVPAASVVLVDGDGVRHAAVVPAGGVTVTQAGPLLAEVTLNGRYGSSWGFTARLTARAGAAAVDVAVGLVNDDDAAESEVAEWSVELDTGPVATAVTGVFSAAHRGLPPYAVQHRGEGHPRGIFATSQVVGGSSWEDVSDPDYATRWEWAELHGRQAVNWLVASRVGGDDVTVAVHRFAENHPSDLAVSPSGVTVQFWPSDAGALRLTQGAAKTRRLRLTGGDDRRAGPVLDSPLVPSLSGPPVPGYLPYLPERYPNLESHIREELSGWYQSGQSLGFHDFGDSVQGITSGPRTGYSANNEHDALLALSLHYLRSGERAYYDSAEAYADHLCDVDLIHHSAHPHEVGGLRAHGRAHVHYVSARTAAGPVRTSIDTGHLWTEGLVLFGSLSGSSVYLDAARRVADCIVGLVDLGWTRPEPGPRNSGWPLMALCAVASATGSAEYVDAAERTAKAAVAAQHPDGRWLMRLGLADDYCAWQNAVLLIGLARLQALSPSAEVAAAFSAGARALLTLGRNRDGSFVYLSRFDYRWANRSALIREALALAFDATGDDAYLRAGLAGGSRWYRPRSVAPALSNDVAEWRGHLPFLLRAHEAGLLTDLPDAG